MTDHVRSNPFLLRDNRKIKDLRKLTFSYFKPSDVTRFLAKAITEGNYDFAIRWTLELLASGLVDRLWKTLIGVYVSDVHVNCPSFILYLDKRYFDEFWTLREQYLEDMPQIRNNQSARVLVVEAAIALTMARKSPLVKFPRLNDSHFTHEVMTSFARAPMQTYATSFIRIGEDPPYAGVALNEIAYGVSDRNAAHVLHWTAWLILYTARLKTAGDELFRVAPRNFSPLIPGPANRDIVWAIWEVILAARDLHPAARDLLLKVFKMYTFQWEASCRTSRKEYIALAMSIIVAYPFPLAEKKILPDRAVGAHMLSKMDQFIAALAHDSETRCYETDLADKLDVEAHDGY